MRAYKFLSHNDTGRSVGHQGGLLIPKDIEGYFPKLSGNVSASQPTVSKWIEAELFDGPVAVGTVDTRYQYQTWGAERSPERRLTSNLTALLGKARKNDVLMMEKHASLPNRYRLTLLRQTTTEWAGVKAKVGGKRWGFL